MHQGQAGHADILIEQGRPHQTQVSCLPELPLLLAGVATVGARGCMPELPSPLVRVVTAATRCCRHKLPPPRVGVARVTVEE